jgi:anionic cell wall polymer biosynthesis LytR-Cps2A-Psr (LCP) family protein
MTKKDYERLARAFARSRPGRTEDYQRLEAWEAVRSAVADELLAENERFNPATFILATNQ